jgi:hypothetical protein
MRPANAIGYAIHSSRSHDAVIRVYDEAGKAIGARAQWGGNFLAYMWKTVQNGSMIESARTGLVVSAVFVAVAISAFMLRSIHRAPAGSGTDRS